jgi:hypothetical protein
MLLQHPVADLRRIPQLSLLVVVVSSFYISARMDGWIISDCTARGWEMKNTTGGEKEKK